MRHVSWPLATLAGAVVGAAVLCLGAAPSPAATYVQEVAADNPVGYWQLNELSGSQAYDSADSLDGTYEGGITYGLGSPITTDPSNTSVGFNGTDTRVRVPDDAALDFAGPFTYEFFVYLNSVATAPELVSKRSNGQDDGANMHVDTSGNLWLHWEVSNTDYAVSSLQTLDTGRWYYLVGTYDGTTASLYVNGQLDNSAPISVAPPATAYDFTIGAPNQSSDFTDGRIDEVAVYNYALSAARIDAHYAAAPEPGTLALLAGGLAWLAARRRRGRLQRG